MDNSGITGSWKIQGILQKKNLWWLMVKMELCTLIFCTKMILVSPYQAEIHLKACSVVEIDV